MNATSATKSRFLDNLELSLLLAMAAALPWELFQRVPPLEITVVKAAGAFLVLVVGARALARRRRMNWTGLEAPLLALLAVMAVATLASEDRRESMGQLTVYATYCVLFCAIAAAASSAVRTRVAAGMFVASSATVGALSIACRFGLATPTLVDTTRITGRWTDETAWLTLTSRMTPASLDFNQGALPLLAAYALALFLFVGGKKGRTWGGIIGALLALAGILTTLSRSSMVLAAGLTAGYVLYGFARGRRRAAAGFALWAAVAVVALSVLMGPAGIVERLTQLAGERDSSVESRMAAFAAGWALLPAYWATGTGPGALDGVIAASEHGTRVGGITVHSVPFKLLLETGVAGLAALLWLYWRALRLHLKGLKQGDEELRAHSTAFLTLGGTLFLITLVQPFMTLALFPFLLGIAAGPLAAGVVRDGEDLWCGRRTCKAVWIGAPAVVVAAVVVGNAVQFYGTVDRVRPFAESLVTAALAEESGDWTSAGKAYSNAGVILEGRGQPLYKERYYAQAAAVLDLAYASEKMGARHRRLNPVAAVAYGQGRLEAAMGNAQRAVERLDAAIDAEPGFAQAHFTAAEILWDAGNYAGALARYGKAKELETERENVEFRQFVAPLDEYIAGAAGSSGAPEQLRRAEFLRKRARWDEAADVYKQVAVRDPNCAEALFNLGVQARLDGKEGEALDFFRRAVNASPFHYQALRELAETSPES